MTHSVQFAETQIHHIALRVADAAASKAWFVTKLDFQVNREFVYGDKDFVWLCPAERGTPLIELIGGGQIASPPQYENALESLGQPGLHHICLQVNDLEQVISELRRREVKILIDVIPGAPGTGVEKGAFIADPFGNIFELLQLFPSSETSDESTRSGRHLKP
jgi:catechol 2,3-dioxygenase-like lactoylglutathione lyase family enzyme